MRSITAQQISDRKDQLKKILDAAGISTIIEFDPILQIPAIDNDSLNKLKKLPIYYGKYVALLNKFKH